MQNNALLRSTTRFAFAASVGLAVLVQAGCGADPQGIIFVEGMVTFPAGDCTLEDNSLNFNLNSVLDVGVTDNSAYGLVLAPKVTSNQAPPDLQPVDGQYPNFGTLNANTILFETARIFYTTDRDEPGVPYLASPLLPSDDANAIELSVGGGLFSLARQTFASHVLAIEAISPDAEEEMKQLASADLTSGDNSFRAFAHVQITGRTTGGTAVKTQYFAQPVDLCQGCLTTCFPGEHPFAVLRDDICNYAQDTRSVECVECVQDIDCFSAPGSTCVDNVCVAPVTP